MRVLFLALLALAVPAAAWPASHRIEPDGGGDFPTIQAGADAASSGDTLLLASGVFRGPGNRDIDPRGKALVIRGAAGDPASCVIDCAGAPGDPHRAFVLASQEGPDFVIEALTVENGLAPERPRPDGGAIYLGENGAPRVRGCRFRGNRASLGGAIFGARTLATVEDCVFEDNGAGQSGGALVFDDNSWPVVERCTFVANNAEAGGALTAYWSLVTLRACTLVANEAWTGAAIAAWSASSVILENCVVAFGRYGGAAACEDAGVMLACCDVYGNAGGDFVGCLSGQEGQDGNVSSDPLFCDLEGGDFHIDVRSPCAPDHSGGCGWIGAWQTGCSTSPAQTGSWGEVKARFLAPRAPAPSR